MNFSRITVPLLIYFWKLFVLLNHNSCRIMVDYLGLYEVLKGWKSIQSCWETAWKPTTDPWRLVTNWVGQWLWHSLSVPCWKLCNRWARKTIVCHLVTRSYCRKACKHTAIPLVTPGALFPLSNSSLHGSDMCSHGCAHDWVPVFALLTHLARRLL